MVLNMGRSVEKTGKSVNDAIAAALSELNLTIDDVHVDVLNEGKAGIFGLLSGKTARVRVSELEEDERVPQPGYMDAARATTKNAAASNYNENVAGTDVAGANAGGEYASANASAGTFGNGAGGVHPLQGEDSVSVSELDMVDDDEEDDVNSKGIAGDMEQYDGSFADSSYGDSDTDENEDDYGDQAFDYEYEINRAIDFLGELWKGIHVSTNMSAEPAEDGFSINIESDDSGILIGHRGETLDAIQYLVNLYMNKGRNTFIRVSIDIENYKKKREAALIRLAGQMADKVVRLRRNFTMDAMNSYERRIIHSVLQNHPKVETYSVGEDPNRKVVITLKNRGGYTPR